MFCAEIGFVFIAVFDVKNCDFWAFFQKVGFYGLQRHERRGVVLRDIGFPDARSGLRCAQRFWAGMGDFSLVLVSKTAIWGPFFKRLACTASKGVNVVG